MNVRELLIETLAHIPPASALDGLTPAAAERRVPGANHSIAEIVAHLNFWATWFCNRCEGTGAPMVTSAATRLAGGRAGSWPELHRQFLSTLERAAALGDDPAGSPSPIAPADRVPAARELHDSRRARAHRQPQRTPSWTGHHLAADHGPLAAAGRQLDVVRGEHDDPTMIL